MSEMTNVYDQPEISLVDGVVKDKTILDIAYNIEAAFDKVTLLIGDTDGAGENVESAYINALASSIGAMDNVEILEPFNQSFEGYQQNFVESIDQKYAVLDMIPENSIVTIYAPNNPGTTWNQKQSITDLANIGDYCVDGKIVTFYKQPTGSYSITYDGMVTGGEGYYQNVLPNIKLLEDKLISKPTVQITANGRYRISVPKTKISSNGISYNEDIDYKLSSRLEQYVSSSGSIECPSEYISFWKKSNGKFSKLNVDHSYIISPNVFEFETDIHINTAQDTIVVAISNFTLSDAIRYLYKAVSSHKHDGNDQSQGIKHSDLIGLIPVSAKTDVVYGGSNIKGNDHPQYFNREGYREGDTGTYNNAILGDILIASTSSQSLFNNIDANSNRLVFGSISGGISLRYNFASKSLLVHSPFNGFDLSSKTGEGKQSFALRLNGHELYNYGVIDSTKPIGDSTRQVNHLSISSISNIVRIADYVDPSKLAGIRFDNGGAKTLNVSDLIEIPHGGTLKLGRIRFTPVTDDLVITSDTDQEMQTLVVHTYTDIDHLHAGVLEADSYRVLKGDKVAFGNDLGPAFGSSKEAPTDVYMEVIQENNNQAQINIVTAKPLNIKDTGKNTGYSSGDESGQYLNIYSSGDSGGKSTPTDRNVFVETNAGDVHFIRDTTTVAVDDGIEYVWAKSVGGKTRVDVLTKWPHSNIVAKNGKFKDIALDVSNMQDKRGISFGTQNLNSIYVTGDGTACPPGWMVIESQNGVVLTKPSAEATSCESMVYGDLTTGDIQAYGNVTVEDDLGVGKDLVVARKATAKDLEIREDSEFRGGARFYSGVKFDEDTTFAAPASFISDITVNGVARFDNRVEANSLLVRASAEFDGVTSFNRDVTFTANANFSKNIYVTETLNVQGLTTLAKVIAGDLSANAIIGNSSIESKGVLTVRSKLESYGPMYGFAGLNVDGNSVFTGALTTNSAEVLENISIRGNVLAEGDVRTNSNLSVVGSAQIGSASSSVLLIGNVQVQSPRMTISGDLRIAGDTITNGNATIVGKVQSSSIDTGFIQAANGIEIDGESKFNNSLTVGGQALFKSNLVSDGSTTLRTTNINGTLTATGLISTAVGVSAPFSSISNLGTLHVAGGLSQADPNSDVTFQGPVIASSGMKVSGTTYIQTFESSDIPDNSTTIQGAYVRIGTNDSRHGVMEVYNAKVGKLRGSVRGNEASVQVLASTLNQKLGSAVINSAGLAEKDYVVIGDSVFDGVALFPKESYFAGKIYFTEMEYVGTKDGGVANIEAKTAKYKSY